MQCPPIWDLIGLVVTMQTSYDAGLNLFLQT